MSFIDEAAKEINVKLVWYSASPGAAAALVRHVAERTRPDLKRIEVVDAGNGSAVTLFQFAPVGLGVRGYTTRFHLYAIESADRPLETDQERYLLFRGADACLFLGGPDEALALARVDAVLAAQGYSNVAIVFGADREAGARGRAFGFPDEDCFAVDVASGAGIFEAFKALAKKILTTMAGRTVPTRATPPPGTAPLAVAPAKSVAPTLEQAQEGLDPWQRAYHAKAVWVLGYELTRVTPSDLPEGYPSHTIHAVRLTSSGGFAVMTNGFARDAEERVELRADTSRYGWQIAMALSFLGRVRHRRLREGGPPWRPFDLVTTSEAPVFGLKHFVLMPAGTVHVNDEPVVILRVAPITPEEHREVAGQIVGDQMAAWLTERKATMLDRWLPALEHDRPFAVG